MLGLPRKYIKYAPTSYDLDQLKLLRLAFATLVLLHLGSANAAWPERPITLVVMYAPGGGTDTGLRTLATVMSAVTGWRINVVNRPGAAGALATRYAMNKPSDGYTLLGTSSFNKYSRVGGGGDSRSWTDWYYMQAATALGSLGRAPRIALQNLYRCNRSGQGKPW